MFILLQSDLVSLDDDNWVKSLSGNPAAELEANKTSHRLKCLHSKLNSRLQTITKSSSGDEIANLNCFTILQSAILILAIQLHSGTNIDHTVFAVNRKQQETTTTVKRKLNDKLQVSNGERTGSLPEEGGFWGFDPQNVVGYCCDPQKAHPWQETHVMAYRSSRSVKKHDIGVR